MKRRLIVLLLLVVMALSIAGPAYGAAIIDLNASIEQATRIVSIHGVIDTGSGQPIQIKVTAPGGAQEYTGVVSSTSGGDFALSYTLTGTTQGTYLVEATGNVGVTKAQTYFLYGNADVGAVPILQTNVSVNANGSNKRLAITPATVALNTPIELTIPNSVQDATINVSQIFSTSPGATPATSAMPAMNITAYSTVSTNPVRVTIPAGMFIIAPSGVAWDGTLKAPVATMSNQIPLPDGTGNTTGMVIEIGASGSQLSLSKAVRIVFPGQAGKRVAWWRGTSFVPIETWLGSDTQSDANAIPPDKEAKIEVGGDMVIWTKHFTRFATFATGTAAAPADSASGELGQIPLVTTQNGQASVSTAAEADIALGSEAAIHMSPKAISGLESMEVKVARITDYIVLPAGQKPAGGIYSFLIGGAVNYDLGKPAEIRLYFDQSVVGSAKVSIWSYDPVTSKWADLGGTAAVPTVSQTTSRLTYFAPLTPDNTPKPPVPVTPTAPVIKFSDTTGHWAEQNIIALVSKSAVNGYPDGTFRPNGYITRAEFVTTLVRALNMPTSGSQTFSDTAYHWARGYIAVALDAGIVGGYEDGTFKPDTLITREQMASMVSKAKKYQPSINPLAFADTTTIATWARDGVASAVQAGVIKGYPDNTFRPKALATRAEAMSVIANATK